MQNVILNTMMVLLMIAFVIGCASAPRVSLPEVEVQQDEEQIAEELLSEEPIVEEEKFRHTLTITH